MNFCLLWFIIHKGIFKNQCLVVINCLEGKLYNMFQLLELRCGVRY